MKPVTQDLSLDQPTSFPSLSWNPRPMSICLSCDANKLEANLIIRPLLTLLLSRLDLGPVKKSSGIGPNM